MNSKSVTFRLAKANPKNTAMQGRTYPVTYSIPSEDVIYDDEGYQHRIRYAVGEQSIYAKDQSEFAQPAPKIKFLDGFHIVLETNKTLINYLRASNFNSDVANKVDGRNTIYKEMDYNKEAAEAFQNEMVKGRAEAEFWIIEKDTDKLRAVARKMKVNVENPAWRNLVLRMVRKSPMDFAAIIDDPQELEMAVRIDHVHQAHEAQVITYGLGRWSWEGGDVICAVPKGADRHAYLANWTYTDKEGHLTFSEIHAKTQALVGPSALELAKIDHEAAANAISHSSFEDLLVKSREAGFVEWKGGKFIYKAEDGMETVIGGSKAQAVDFMKEDPQLLKEIKRRLMNL